MTTNYYICEFTRRIVHPENGLPHPELQTFQDWITLVEDRPGWVNAGMDEKTSHIFSQLPFGQVITNTCSDVSLFRFGDLGNIVQKALYSPRDKPEFRVVMNYVSFEKFIRLLHQDLPPLEKNHLETQFRLWKQTISPHVFWIHFLISQERINYLQRNQIGVIITTAGDSSFFRNMEEEKVSLFNIPDGLHHRILLNNRDLIHLFNMAYMIKNPNLEDRKKDNFFELLGGYEGDLLEDIMKLSLM